MKFYVLETKNYNMANIIFTWEKEVNPFSCPNCKVNHWGEMSPLSIEIHGNKLSDYDKMVRELISKKVVEVIIDNEITGCVFKPVKIVEWTVKKKKQSNISFEYYEMIVNGRAGLLKDLNGEVMGELCPYCHHILDYGEDSSRGFMVDEKEWDGSDIFYLSNLISGFPIVTEKVKNIFELKKIINVKFTAIEDFIFNF